MKAEDLSGNTEADVNYLQIIALGRGTVGNALLSLATCRFSDLRRTRSIVKGDSESME